MSLPDISKLESLAKKTEAEKEQLGLPTSGWVWSSAEGPAGNAYFVTFSIGSTNSYYKYISYAKVLCVGD